MISKLLPLREVNHMTPLIDEGKQYSSHLPRCPDALKQQQYHTQNTSYRDRKPSSNLMITSQTGPPLSMLLYIIYNSDLIDIVKGKNKLTLAFVDDAAFIAIGKTFQETHVILTNMLECEGGVINGRKTTIHILNPQSSC